MGLFGTSDNTVQEEVDQATSDNKIDEDWSIIMSICDKAGKSREEAQLYLKAIIKRLYNPDPHVGVKAVTVLDACIKNSGKHFHVEVASRDFENEFTKLMTKSPGHVAQKLRDSLKKWAENEFKSDPQLALIPTLYKKMKGSYDFSSSDTPVKKSTPKSTDPNVVESQEEEDQILKAIELSLKDTPGSPRNAGNTSLYPSVNSISSTATANASVVAPTKEPKKVRALYDFEAAEDNELTFNSGELIVVIDDSDPNWWKGSNHRGEGLFPANFVTADLTVEPEKFLIDKTKKMVQFKEEVKVLEKEPQEIEVNEEKVDRLLHLLHEADPTNLEADTDELLSLEREVNAMGPSIDSELERVDRKHAQLTQLSADLVEALSLYHTLMREPQMSTMGKTGYEPQYGYLPPSSGAMPYNGPPYGMQQMPPLPYNLPGGSQLPVGPPGMLQFSGIPPQHAVHALPNPQSNPMPMHPPGMSSIPHQGVSGHPQGGLPPNYQPMIEDRRMDGGMMPPQFQPHMPANYGLQHLPQATFPNSGPVSQPPIQNGPTQTPHFVSSSTHMIQ